MDSRKENLLYEIIESYIKTFEPVGSKQIASSDKFELSPATIRNEMADLEKMGYITHPHISAGRIPTEKGYKYFVDNFLEEKDLTKKEQEFLEVAFSDQSQKKMKNLAKGVAEISRVGVFIAFDDNNLYYTGISNLFSHPEFYSYQFTHSMSEIIDGLDEVISDIFDQVQKETEIMIGKDNPFGEECSSMIMPFKQKNSPKGLFGILGPLRMDYQKNYSVLQFAKKLINE